MAVAEDAGQHAEAAEVADAADPDAAELEREADEVIRDQRDRERRDVHHHHVAGVFRSGEARDEERESDLHEQHEEAGQQQPRHVDRHDEVAALVRELVQPDLRDRDLQRLGDLEVRRGGDVRRRAGLAAVGISLRRCPLTDCDQGDEHDHASTPRISSCLDTAFPRSGRGTRSRAAATGGTYECFVPRARDAKCDGRVNEAVSYTDRLHRRLLQISPA